MSWCKDEDAESAEVFTDVLENLSQTLRNKNFAVSEVELHWVPSNTVVSACRISDHCSKLIDALEDLDDVQNVTLTSTWQIS